MKDNVTKICTMVSLYIFYKFSLELLALRKFFENLIIVIRHAFVKNKNIFLLF